jgi:hypothetical protein
MWNVCFVRWVCLGFILVNTTNILETDVECLFCAMVCLGLTLVNTTNILETDVECLFCGMGLSGFYSGECY